MNYFVKCIKSPSKVGDWPESDYPFMSKHGWFPVSLDTANEHRAKCPHAHDIHSSSGSGHGRKKKIVA
jgi:hypothetical protein